MEEKLFQGDDVIVLTNFPVDDKAVVVVTFEPVQRNKKDKRRSGFGAKFFMEAGIPAIHFISQEKNWYQSTEMAACIAAAYASRQGFSRCVTYGSSMGGYAALKYSRDLDADAVIAMAPQFSIDPSKVPFETRWLRYSSVMSFESDDMNLGINPRSAAYVFYDDISVDAKHVKLITAPNVVRCPVPLSGHAVAGMLGEIGELKETVKRVITGTFDPVTLRLMVRTKRRNSEMYYRHLFENAAARRPKLAVYALDRLAALHAAPGLIIQLAKFANKNGSDELAAKAILLAHETGADASDIAGYVARICMRAPSAELGRLLATIAPELDVIDDDLARLIRRAAKRLREIGATGEAESAVCAAFGRAERNKPRRAFGSRG